jgi:membrane protein implicated in regulation of membrane protease activity
MAVSPWWWVALAILLGAIEMLTPTTVLVWSALAAVVTAAVLWLVPLGLAAQVALFAVASIVFTLAGRALFQRSRSQDDGSTLNRRADQVLGREAVVVAFDHGDGQVTVDGVPWPARLEAGSTVPQSGDRVLVTGAEGIVVRVRPV